MPHPSLFESEAAEAPALAARQFDRLHERLPELIGRIDRVGPTLLATIARGSSDHAAAYAGYLVGLRLGLPAASLPPSLASVYQRTLRLDRAIALAISQSGASPDLCAAVERAKAGGAFALGLVNETGSALGRTVDVEIEIDAGAERAVAATKSFVLSVTAVTHLVAAWARDTALVDALHDLPGVLAQCGSVNWSAGMQTCGSHDDVFVIGRGPSLPVAQELALKLKEVCGMHAEALSAAELLHGPISIASPALPAMVLAGDEATRETVNAAVSRLRAAGAPVVILGTARDAPALGADVVVMPDAPDPVLQPVVAAQAAYAFFAQLARSRGRDPDSPPQLQKITRTR
jgi:glucosamine--fructose-6-phosphate aminotransferase (isomerizing)